MLHRYVIDVRLACQLPEYRVPLSVEDETIILRPPLDGSIIAKRRGEATESAPGSAGRLVPPGVDNVGLRAIDVLNNESAGQVTIPDALESP